MYWHEEQVLLRATQWQREALASAQARREMRDARRRTVFRRLARACTQVLSAVI
jgi:hypothetical protein